MLRIKHASSKDKMTGAKHMQRIGDGMHAHISTLVKWVSRGL